jgi:hypothetical protein
LKYLLNKIKFNFYFIKDEQKKIKIIDKKFLINMIHNTQISDDNFDEIINNRNKKNRFVKNFI